VIEVVANACVPQFIFRQTFELFLFIASLSEDFLQIQLELIAFFGSGTSWATHVLLIDEFHNLPGFHSLELLHTFFGAFVCHRDDRVTLVIFSKTFQLFRGIAPFLEGYDRCCCL